MLNLEDGDAQIIIIIIMDFKRSIMIRHGIVDSLISNYDYDDRDSMAKVSDIIDNIEAIHRIKTNHSEVETEVDFLNEHSSNKNFLDYMYVRGYSMIPDVYVHAKISENYLHSISSQFERELK